MLLILRLSCFDFDNTPRKFIDIETGEEVSVFADVKQEYEKQAQLYFKRR
jgi:hypothetical protein